MSFSQLFRVLHFNQVSNCIPAIRQWSLNLVVILYSALAPSLAMLGFSEYGLKIVKVLFEFVQIESYSRQDVLCLQLTE